MESWKRIQTKERRDDEEVNMISFHRFVLTAVFMATWLLFITSALAQTGHAPFVIDNPKDFHRYALYCPRPEYPPNLRDRRLAGSGKFLLQIRPNGTVQSLETLSSTGHGELDDVAKTSFIKWRFRPGPTAAKIPITFKVPPGTYGWPFSPR